IVDAVAGRDGSILATDIESLRYGDGSRAALGAPAAPAPAEKPAGPLVSPLADDDFLVLPDLRDKAALIEADPLTALSDDAPVAWATGPDLLQAPDPAGGAALPWWKMDDGDLWAL
ncbi:MAG: hypothetical protein SWI22_15860, partial [Pseudomonadota bacterium]|nr:hypothetical protein [Pseudomonadota bacterium]